MEKAINFHEQALSIAQEIGDRRREGEHKDNLGRIYLELGEVEKAGNLLRAAQAIFEETKDPRAKQVKQVLEEMEED